MKKLFVFVFLLAFAMQAFAEPAKSPAKMRLTFGWLRGANGIAQSVKNVEFEIGPVIKLDSQQVKTVRLVKNPRKPVLGAVPPPAKRDEPHDLVSLAEKLVGSQLHANASAPGALFDQSVYATVNGLPNPQPGQNNFYVLAEEYPDPSTLDDTVMASGAGKLWKRIWIGIRVNIDRQFLIRWKIFDNALSGTGHNEDAFADLIGPNNILGDPAGDFGGFLTPGSWLGWQGPGDYLVPIDLPAPSSMWPGINCPDNTIYMGQQFREPQANGEGPFDFAFKTIYTADIPVGTGTSQDGFWYDWDDLDGKYASDEFEVLGDINGQPQPYSNVCRAIITSGASAEFGPFFAQLTYGILVSGNTPELQDSDNQYMIFKPSWIGARTDPNAQVIVEAQSPNANVTGFRFSTEVGATSGGGTMKIELFNFSTNAYVLYDTRAVTSTDANVEVTVPSNFAQYVRASDRRVRSRISFFASGVERTFAFRMDRARWIVTYP